MCHYSDTVTIMTLARIHRLIYHIMLTYPPYNPTHTPSHRPSHTPPLRYFNYTFAFPILLSASCCLETEIYYFDASASQMEHFEDHFNDYEDHIDCVLCDMFRLCTFDILTGRPSTRRRLNLETYHHFFFCDVSLSIVISSFLILRCLIINCNIIISH